MNEKVRTGGFKDHIVTMITTECSQTFDLCDIRRRISASQ